MRTLSMSNKYPIKVEQLNFYDLNGTYHKQFKTPEGKGYLGEQETAKILKQLDPTYYYVINNVLLRDENTKKLTQIDHLVLSIFGVFIIETKNYRGTIIGDEIDQTWLQITDTSQTDFYSPILQNYAHERVLKSLLTALADLRCYSLVCFPATTECKVKTKRTHIVNHINLLTTIQECSTTPRYLLGQVDEMVNTINQANQRHDPIIRQEHQQSITRSVAQRQKNASATGVICPKCGRPAVKRKGDRKPRFCLNFPHCELQQLQLEL